MRIHTEISSDQDLPVSDRVRAAKRPLRLEIGRAGLSRVADHLDTLMMPSIRLRATAASEKDFEVGSSKLGGRPDLPNDVAWPECDGVPMALLAQLRLQDVVPYDLEGLLPKSGMLYFFYDAQEQKWGFDPEDRGHWKVIYYDGDTTGLQATTPPVSLPEESRFQACTLAFSNHITLPSWESIGIERLKLTEKERDTYIELLSAMYSENETIHRLLGHPEQIQGEMQLECQLTSNGIYTGNSIPRQPELEKGAVDWRLLLQIDSDEENLGAMWGDTGRVYFWIRCQDLEKRDFDNVWVVLQCY